MCKFARKIRIIMKEEEKQNAGLPENAFRELKDGEEYEPLMAADNGRISRGKYTFLITPAFALTHVTHSLTTLEKKVHGMKMKRMNG
jgi:hypothetical protein